MVTINFGSSPLHFVHLSSPQVLSLWKRGLLGFVFFSMSKNTLKQDQVNNVNSALIFMIIFLIMQVVQVVQVVRVAWVVRVVSVINLVNAYGLHGLNNQIIEKI